MLILDSGLLQMSRRRFIRLLWRRISIIGVMLGRFIIVSFLFLRKHDGVLTSG